MSAHYRMVDGKSTVYKLSPRLPPVRVAGKLSTLRSFSPSSSLKSPSQRSGRWQESQTRQKRKGLQSWEGKLEQRLKPFGGVVRAEKVQIGGEVSSGVDDINRVEVEAPTLHACS